MRIINIITVCFLMVISLKAMSSSTFTTIALLDDQLLFAGVKLVRPGMEMESHLVQVGLDDLKLKKINLPAQIENREIVAIIATEEGYLLIVTQITRGGGDRPQVHSFRTKGDEWQKVGEVDCVSFSKIQLHKKSLEFSCEQTNNEGQVRMVTRAVTSPYSLYPQELKLPITQFELKHIKGQLVEKDLEWSQLKIKKGKEEKVFVP